MRTIDADKTIGLLKTRLYETALNNANVNCDASQIYTECADNRIEVWIDEIPTVETEPVKHGRWIKNGDRYCECSVCHHEGNISGQDNFCWFCGAKMDVSDTNVGKMDETCN